MRFVVRCVPGRSVKPVSHLAGMLETGFWLLPTPECCRLSAHALDAIALLQTRLLLPTSVSSSATGCRRAGDHVLASHFGASPGNPDQNPDEDVMAILASRPSPTSHQRMVATICTQARVRHFQLTHSCTDTFRRAPAEFHCRQSSQQASKRKPETTNQQSAAARPPMNPSPGAHATGLRNYPFRFCQNGRGEQNA